MKNEPSRVSKAVGQPVSLPHLVWVRREREREVLHLSSHTRLIQVLPGQPLAHPRV